MLRQSNSRLVSGIARKFGTSSWVCANHYDALGITPKATQGDIKSAYYKLSKIHHPDISKTEESAKKFRAITEAYEVLGNIKLKKMYDKGLLVGRENTTGMQYQPEPEPTDPTLKFYKSRTHRHVMPTMDGKTPIYNFDAWSQHHYGNLFQKAKYEREFVQKKRAKQADAEQSQRQESLIYLVFAITGIFIIMVVNGTTDYDTDALKKSKTQGPQKSKTTE